MKKLIIGFILGVTFVGVAWAAQRATMINGSGNEVGVTGSPLYIQGV